MGKNILASVLGVSCDFQMTFKCPSWHEPAAPTSMKKISPFVSVPACTTNVCFFMCRLPLDRTERSRPFWGKRDPLATSELPSHRAVWAQNPPFSNSISIGLLREAPSAGHWPPWTCSQTSWSQDSSNIIDDPQELMFLWVKFIDIYHIRNYHWQKF